MNLRVRMNQLAQEGHIKLADLEAVYEICDKLQDLERENKRLRSGGTGITIGDTVRLRDMLQLRGAIDCECTNQPCRHYEALAEVVQKAMDAFYLSNPCCAKDHARVCGKVGCVAATIKLDSGGLQCAMGHPTRWVEREDLESWKAKAEKWQRAAQAAGRRADDAERDVRYLTDQLENGGIRGK